jgi:glycolate oxidase FAD binding subunit
MVLADGTMARSGGHVIKNVAGYDLAKLLHGSYGTLGVLAEVVLRLHPIPERSATLAIHCSLDEAAAHAATVLGGPYEPAALEWTSDGVLLIRLEGTADALDARMQRLRTALGTGELLNPGASPDESAVRRLGTDESAARRSRTGVHMLNDPGSGAEQGDVPPGDSAPPPSDERHARRLGTDESAVRRADPWVRHASLVRGDPGLASLRIGVRPSRLPGVLSALPTTAVTAGLGTGVATVSLPPDAVAEAHARVHAAGGTSVLRSRPPEADVPAWGQPPSTIGVLRAVKAELDPQGRFGPGRFDPWM